MLLLLQPRQLISTGCWLWMHWYAAGCNAAVQHIQASESLLDGCYYFSRMSYCIGYFLASYSSYLVEADSGLPVCQFSCSVDWFVTLYPNPAVNGETHGCVLSLNGGSQAGRSMCRCAVSTVGFYHRRSMCRMQYMQCGFIVEGACVVCRAVLS